MYCVTESVLFAIRILANIQYLQRSARSKSCAIYPAQSAAEKGGSS